MRKRLAALCAALLTIGIAPIISLTTATPASALANGLALTPPMGWNDWNGYQCNNTATDVEQTALYIHTSGLQADGYDYVNNDGCWDDMVGLGSADPSGRTLTTLPAEACGAVNGRLPDGEIFINTTEFPPSTPCANDGFKIVSNYVHSLGLKFGLYLNASNNWNGEEIPGSYGFDTEDANTFASWGVDYVKADWGVSATTVPPTNDPLGGPTFGTQPAPLNLSQLQLAQLMYGALGQALAATGRPIVYSIAGAGVPSPQDWGAPVANLVRPAGDSAPTFASLLNIINTDDQYAADQTPGAWIDPDIMEVGNGMSKTEDESEMSMFAELGSPLLMSTNLVNPAGGAAQQAQNLAIFGNKDVIAVDQDTLGKMGTVVSSANGLDVFAKPLSNGDTAVALFNTTTVPSTISTTAAAVGMTSPLPIYTLKDLWSKQVTETAGTISAFVPAHGTVMYRVS
jgi:alpha-galactosidase